MKINLKKIARSTKNNFTLLIFTSLWLFVSSLSLALDPISIEATHTVDKEGKLIINFHVAANESFSIEKSELPWRASPFGFTMIATTRGAGAGMKRAYIPEILPFGQIRIEKGNSAEGSLKLENYFPDVDGLRKETDILFFWHWLPFRKSVKDIMLNEQGYGGCIFIPKEK